MPGELHEWSSAYIDSTPPRSVLSFTILEPHEHLASRLGPIGFTWISEPPSDAEWDALRPLDDRLAWAELRDPEDCFVVLIDRTTGFIAALTDIDLTGHDEYTFMRTAAAGLEVRITLAGRSGLLVAKVPALTGDIHR